MTNVRIMKLYFINDNVTRFIINNIKMYVL